MRRLGSAKADTEWLKKLGKRVGEIILENGYRSPYDFWVQRAGDHISRATLNFILLGKTDPKATTLRKLAQLLKVPPSRLIDLD